MTLDTVSPKMDLQGADHARPVLIKSFIWMLGGLILAALAALWVGTSDLAQLLTASSVWLLLVIPGVWFITTFAFKPLVRILPAGIGAVLFIIYAVLTGLSLSLLLETYTTASVLQAFIAAALLFSAMVFIGSVSKMSLGLTRFFMFAAAVAMGLFGVINFLFFKSPTIDWLISLGGIVLFAFSTATAVQEIVAMSRENNPKLQKRLVIVGALTLFTNFIRIFLRLLQMMGKQRTTKSQS